MFTPKTALFTFVATCALAMGACQPSEGPAEQAGKTVDSTTRQVGQEVDKTADKVDSSVSRGAPKSDQKQG